MNIKDLENFYYVSEYKSFSLAAKMKGVTQPTLSESIKRLENDIGVQLFYRSKKGISLTSLGQKTLNEVIELLNIKDKIGLIAKEIENIPQTLSLGCHDTVAGYFFKEFLQNVSKKLPNLTLNLQHDHSRNIQNLIQDGTIDIGVVVNPIENPDLIISEVCVDKICVWKAKNKKVSINQFVGDLNLIQLQSILRNWKKAPLKHINTTSFKLIAELAESGLGYAILPEKYVVTNKYNLVQVQKNIFFKDQFAIVYRPEFGKNSVEKQLIKELKNAIK